MWLVLTTGTEGNLIQWEVRRPYSTPRIFQPLSGGAHNMKRKRDKVTKINTSAKKIRQRVLYSACWQGARLQARTANRCSSCKYKWTVGTKRRKKVLSRHFSLTHRFGFVFASVSFVPLLPFFGWWRNGSEFDRSILMGYIYWGAGGDECEEGRERDEMFGWIFLMLLAQYVSIYRTIRGRCTRTRYPIVAMVT